MIGVLLAGRKLFVIWPRIGKLNMVFAAGYIIKVLEFGNKAVPIALAFIVVWYFLIYRLYPITPTIISWPAVLACMMFLLLLPILGYWKLGVFAKQPLTKVHLKWYHLVCVKADLAPVINPDYLILAMALKKALQKPNVDKSFLDEI